MIEVTSVAIKPKRKKIRLKIRRSANKLRKALPIPRLHEQKPASKPRNILNAEYHDSVEQLSLQEVCIRVVTLAQTMKEHRFYPYQVEVAYRIAESLLLHDGEVITSLMARQMGKTEVIGSIVAAIAVIFPVLAKQYPKSWHLNITDDKGVYRGYSMGIKVGIYAPRLEQSGIMFDRVKQSLETDTSKKILKELGMTVEESNGNTVRLSNGSRVLCQSASEQSKIEGATHHLLIAEEAQDITDLKMKKSLHPMVSATGGTIVKVGTATTKKCDFYTAIKQNERAALVTGKKNHFFYPYTVGIQFNSLYKKTIEREKIHLGEDSDEFRTSYCGEWIFERGMFVTTNQLFNNQVAASGGVWACRYHGASTRELGSQYSVVAGIDWGSASDSTVITTTAVDWVNPLEEGEGYSPTGSFRFSFFQKHVLDWVEYIGDNYELQFHNVVHYLLSIPKLKKVTLDSNSSGKPMYDRLRATLGPYGIECEEFNFSAKLKSDGYKALYADICGKRLTFPAGHGYRDGRYLKFVGQMLDLKKEYRNGIMKVAHPDEKDAHDDYPDSLMLSAWGAGTPITWGDVTLDANPFFRG